MNNKAVLRIVKTMIAIIILMVACDMTKPLLETEMTNADYPLIESSIISISEYEFGIIDKSFYHTTDRHFYRITTYKHKIDRKFTYRAGGIYPDACVVKCEVVTQYNQSNTEYEVWRAVMMAALTFTQQDIEKRPDQFKKEIEKILNMYNGYKFVNILVEV